jgi:hypothetical protein
MIQIQARQNLVEQTSLNYLNGCATIKLCFSCRCWITFYANKLWWCFSNPIITLLPDKTKTRPVIGKWSDKDINGNVLLASNLSGKLLMTQGFRGTICSVPERKYAIGKINCEQIKEVFEVEQV